MRALLSVAPGGPESLVIGDRPDPVPGAGEVCLTVHACAINYPDVLIIEDRYQYKPERPFSPGVEVSGIVEALGPGVDGLAVGQRVIASVGWGGLAEKVNAEVVKCVPMPDDVPFDIGASLLVTYGTTYHALVDKAGIKAGETLFVLGASGGVGLAAIEVGRALGARVVAAVSTPEKAEIARAAGASDVIIYPATPDDPRALTALFKAALPSGADVIYDAVGGGYAEPALRSIAWEGRYLVIGFAAGIPTPPFNLMLLKGCSIIGIFWGVWLERNPERHKANNNALLQFYRDGLIKPFISERFPLERGGEAIRRLADRKAVGKLVVIP
ncbi:MAG: NADPH:quinone oxidoreductase [Sphingomonadales bacterium]|nr:NADPH:quinone oxidoreductase [Sphingomonadales bacterium]